MANRPTHSVIFGQLDAERAAQEVSLAIDFGELRLNFTSLNRPVVRWPASALVNITDSDIKRGPKSAIT